jgi:hypothetical protein
MRRRRRVGIVPDVLTTRRDRFLTLAAFLISFWVVLGLAGLVFGPFGPIELALALVLALPLTLFVNRALRVVLEKR